MARIRSTPAWQSFAGIIARWCCFAASGLFLASWMAALIHTFQRHASPPTGLKAATAGSTIGLFGEEQFLGWDWYGFARLFAGSGLFFAGVLLIGQRSSRPSRRTRRSKFDWAIELRIALLFATALFWTGASIPNWDFTAPIKGGVLLAGWVGQGVAAFFLARRFNFPGGLWATLSALTCTTIPVILVFMPPRIHKTKRPGHR